MSQNRILRIPLKSKTFFIEEGWLYSREERAIHKLVTHRGIDFRVKPATPIVAAADGYAVGSYQHSLRYFKNKIMKYKGKSLGYGYGYFVIMYHPTVNLFTLYAHLLHVSKKLRFIQPQGEWPSLKSKLLSMKASQILARGKKIRAGTIVGWSGDSGCTWGYTDYPDKPRKAKTWDGPHLHFEVFTRTKNNQRKFIDPFGIYKVFQAYPRRLSKSSLSMWRA